MSQKKLYQRPELHSYGSVEEITLNRGGKGGADAKSRRKDPKRKGS